MQLLAAVAELADALDSKSSGEQPCRFESGQRHFKTPEKSGVFCFCVAFRAARKNRRKAHLSGNS